jgi:NADH-quinone oxidoreductase subunit M
MFMSSMGLPLLNGFVGEFTILQGTFMENKAWAAWAVPGVILAAAYLLWLYQRVFFGPVNNPKNEKLLDLSGRELATFIPLVAIAFWIGLYPKPFFQILSTPVNNLVATVRPDYPGLQKPVLATQPASPTPSESPVVVPQPVTSPETEKPAAVTQKSSTVLSPSANRRSLGSGEQKRLASARDDKSRTAAASSRVVRTFRSASGPRNSYSEPGFSPAVPVNTARANIALAVAK